MQCPGCRKEILPDATVCPQCGKLLVPPVMAPPFPYHLYPYAAYPPQPQEYASAPHGARIGAYLLDGVFASLLAIPGVVVFFALLFSLMPFDGKDSEAFPAMFFVIFPLYFIALLPSMAYSFCRDGLKGGASWGKRICGLRVVHLETGRPCTFGRSFLRHVLNFVNVYGIVTIIEIIMVLSRPDRRRLGDQIASTMVIPADTPTLAPRPRPQWQPPHYTQPYAGHAPPPPREPDSHGPPPMR